MKSVANRRCLKFGELKCMGTEAQTGQGTIWIQKLLVIKWVCSLCSLAAIVVCSSMGDFSFSFWHQCRAGIYVEHCVVVVNFRSAQHCDCVLCFFHLNKLFIFYHACIILNFQSSRTQFCRNGMVPWQDLNETWIEWSRADSLNPPPEWFLDRNKTRTTERALSRHPAAGRWKIFLLLSCNRQLCDM